MKHVRTVLSTLGGILLAALFIAALAPKAARGVAVALAQIVPGTTTHIGQNESRMVNLLCSQGNEFCNSVDSSGNIATTPFQVPAGFTLIVTDYAFTVVLPASQAGNFACDTFLDQATFRSFLPISICAVADKLGVTTGRASFTTGIRVGSGITIIDSQATNGFGGGGIQGYLVPNN